MYKQLTYLITLVPCPLNHLYGPVGRVSIVGSRRRSQTPVTETSGKREDTRSVERSKDGGGRRNGHYTSIVRSGDGESTDSPDVCRPLNVWSGGRGPRNCQEGEGPLTRDPYCQGSDRRLKGFRREVPPPLPLRSCTDPESEDSLGKHLEGGRRTTGVSR